MKAELLFDNDLKFTSKWRGKKLLISRVARPLLLIWNCTGSQNAEIIKLLRIQERALYACKGKQLKEFFNPVSKGAEQKWNLGWLARKRLALALGKSLNHLYFCLSCCSLLSLLNLPVVAK